MFSIAGNRPVGAFRLGQHVLRKIMVNQGLFDYLRLSAAKSALHLRSVRSITTAFHGLRCHPLICMLLS